MDPTVNHTQQFSKMFSRTQQLSVRDKAGYWFKVVKAFCLVILPVVGNLALLGLVRG